MKHVNKGRIYVFVIMVIAGLLSCSDSESKFKPLPGQTAVIINLNLPPEHPTAYDDTIWNKIRRIFVQDAIAQSAPAMFSSISVTVTGPDIGAIQQTFNPAPTITLSVPAGDLRRFDVTAMVAPGDPSAALSFSGTTTTNLPAGQTVNLPVLMLLNETKIVVPDNSNSRIVTMDNMSGANFNPRNALGVFGVSFPNDVSFDSRGRIYVGISSTNGVIRADNPNGDNAIIFGVGGVQTIAVDRTNNVLYYATGSSLYKNRLDGANEQQLANFQPSAASFFINGIDVYTNGMLLIVGTDDTNASYIVLYDPNASLIVGKYTSTSLLTPWDVLSVPPYIYIANLVGRTNEQILRFSLDSAGNFIPEGSYGTQGTTTAPGVFFGARRFLGIRNDALIIADSDSVFLSQLISIGDISGTGWTAFGTHGNGVNQFKLWASC